MRVVVVKAYLILLRCTFSIDFPNSWYLFFHILFIFMVINNLARRHFSKYCLYWKFDLRVLIIWHNVMSVLSCWFKYIFFLALIYWSMAYVLLSLNLAHFVILFILSFIYSFCLSNLFKCIWALRLLIFLLYIEISPFLRLSTIFFYNYWCSLFLATSNSYRVLYCHSSCLLEFFDIDGGDIIDCNLILFLFIGLLNTGFLNGAIEEFLITVLSSMLASLIWFFGLKSERV